MDGDVSSRGPDQGVDVPDGDSVRQRIADRAAAHRADAYVSFFEPVTSLFAAALVDGLGPAAPGRVVLDLGAGGGSLAVAAAGAGWRVVAVDHEPAFACRCRERDVPAVLGDAQALPFADAAVDAVAAGFLLPHLPDLDAALAEVVRVLRPGGVLAALGWASVERSPFTGLASKSLAEHASPDVRDHLSRARARTEPALLREASSRAGLQAGVATLTETVELESAAVWWRGMVGASSGFAELLTTQTAAVRGAVEDRFRVAAARFATGSGDRLRVPVVAHLLTAVKPAGNAVPGSSGEPVSGPGPKPADNVRS